MNSIVLSLMNHKYKYTLKCTYGNTTFYVVMETMLFLNV